MVTENVTFCLSLPVEVKKMLKNAAKIERKYVSNFVLELLADGIEYRKQNKEEI